MSIFDRLLAKTRFSTALPAVAAIMALCLSVLFDGVYAGVIATRSAEEAEVVAQRVIALIEPDLAAGDITKVSEHLNRFAPGAMALIGPDGQIIAGDAEPAELRQWDAYPVMSGGERVATLHAARLVPGGFPMPLPMIILTTLLVVGAAYWLASYFGRVASAQVQGLGETLDRVRRGHDSRSGESPLFFSEFRQLRAQLVRTVLQLRAEVRRLSEAAYTDERTGLGNAARLTQQLTDFISHSSFEEPAAYILIDADGLQQATDPSSSVMPHETHAAMARRIAQFVSAQEAQFSVTADHWPVFALQSDEFAILIDRLGGRHEIMRFVRNLLDALRQPYVIGGQSHRLPAAAGIVMIPEDGQSPQEIRKRAESALFQARRSDNVDLHFYSPKLDRQNAARKRLESEVRSAVENKRFVPVFQPKVDLRTGRIVGAEALARWKLESGRIVSPSVFIPVAEATGLINEIGMQITRQACLAGAQWQRMGFHDVSVAVNVSPLQFESDDLGGDIINAMSEAGLPPRLLQLEITESVAVSDPDRLRDVIGPLKTMGVKLAIDDFGTGHSNLAMLGRLSFDVFKIDRSFISSLYSDKQAPAIVEMILGMAETLGMETVAEGVETEAQQNFLRRRGCDQYQGFYYSPPVALDRFIDMLREDRERDAADVS